MIRDERVHTLTRVALEAHPIEGSTLICGLDLPGQTWHRWGPTATVLPPDGAYQRVVLRLPKGRRNLRAMLHVVSSCLVDVGEVWLVGSNDEGIKSANKSLGELFEEVQTVDTRRKCRLWSGRTLRMQLQPLGSFRTRVEAHVGSKELVFDTLPGLFAEGRLDDATCMLLKNVQVKPGERVLDFGCGSGAIGVFYADANLLGIDNDAWAVECAQHNGVDARLSDGWSAIDETFEHIISNPPFHAGKDTDFRVMQDLLVGAKDRLKRHGKLSFVCPSTTPVEPVLSKHFRLVKAIARDPRSTVWQCS